MSDIIMVALISATGAVINTLIGAAILWFQKKTHDTFNSKMDSALRAQHSLGNAEGRLAEQSDKRIRDGEAALTQAQIDETIIK